MYIMEIDFQFGDFKCFEYGMASLHKMFSPRVAKRYLAVWQGGEVPVDSNTRPQQ